MELALKVQGNRPWAVTDTSASLPSPTRWQSCSIASTCTLWLWLWLLALGAGSTESLLLRLLSYAALMCRVSNEVCESPDSLGESDARIHLLDIVRR